VSLLCLVTRTQPGADTTAALLQARGLHAIAIPAAKIMPTGASVNTGGVQALLMTSAAAARSTLANDAIRALPVYAVGDATAQAAIAAGFETVISAGGDGAALAVLAADRMKPSDGALLHLRGQEVAGDVTGMLNACGFETRLLEVYHTQDHPEFPAKLRTYLTAATGHVLFHSPAGARRFAAAIEGNVTDLGGWSAFGLSAACLAPIENQGFGASIPAARPEEEALIEAVFTHLPHSGT
jgi:uroporphyrinogen-III synthase